LRKAVSWGFSVRSMKILFFDGGPLEKDFGTSKIDFQASYPLQSFEN
jgi:hypothetical protein